MKPINVTKEEARESINRLAQTKDGKILLAVLQKECGFMNNLMSMDDPNKTQVFAAMRGVYAKMRRYIQPEYLVDIEYKISIIEDQPKKKPDKEGD